MTIQQHIFTTFGVWWWWDEFVHFPPQRGRSDICGRGDGRHTVRVNSSMGRFFSGYIKSYGAIGDNRLIAVVSLSEQGYSGRRSGLAMRSSINSLSLFSTCSNEQPCFAGKVDTGFVTFTVYEWDRGGKADAAPAERVPRRLQSSHAGSRVVLKDGLRISPLRKGQWAGCDAGKGAMELAAGSLASKEYIRGMHGMSAVAACLG
ncbi:MULTISPECIES: hypothetical protein [Rhizobium]|uniref:hypothetical protein n=1 Tax=Rhizobium TaxID=379 RepID=UPI0017F249EC|nr:MULTISPECIES: hypothetical protein [Rhizobium]MBB4507459.1 hypothetical protein [Rhizobium leguminosarum]WSH09960.1 hypothetical protein U8P72_10545 [Rhizobium johnstonii]WSH46228.1 hypothetical protein U8P77_10565 [Rhizobium johnstonii]